MVLEQKWVLSARRVYVIYEIRVHFKRGEAMTPRGCGKDVAGANNTYGINRIPFCLSEDVKGTLHRFRKLWI